MSARRAVRLTWSVLGLSCALYFALGLVIRPLPWWLAMPVFFPSSAATLVIACLHRRYLRRQP